MTYATTHFSTYLLVDSVKWFNAWKLDLDYRNYKEDEPVVNYEIVFICDASGSMKGSRIAAAKTAIYHFVDAMGANDEAAIVKFNGSAYVNCDFTDDKQTLKNGIDAITASGKTNVNSGLTKAFSLFENHSSEKKKVAILLCDGDVNYNQSTINSFKEAEIPIYSINLISSYSHYYLQKMADETGGEYYYAFSEDELQNCFVFIQDKTVDASDQTDTDEDGLIDAYELVGMRMPNGDIVVTDPENKYSDKDGLTDFEEVGIPYEINYVYKGKALITGATYFKVRSNPRDEDTDDDGMLDHMDIYPWRPTYRIAAKLNNRFQDVEYLNICENTGAEVKEYHGGNQDWWLAKSEVPFTKDIDYHYCDIDTNYRLAKCGCGIIAVNDFEVYLFQQNTGFSAVNGASPVVYDEKTGAIQKEVYEGYVENNWITQRYTIRDRDWFNYSVGLFPFDMECGIKDFLKHNHSNYNNVEWAPFCFKANSIQKELVLSEIIRLLNKNTPVICAYHNPDNPLMMYAEIDDAKLNLSTDELDTKYGMYHGKSNKISSHYMTIIGVQEYIDSDSNRTEYLLEIESWGKKFYIRYDQYANNINYATNILRLN